MKVTVKETKLYSFETPTGKLDNFTKGTTWNGLTEFHNKDGKLIVLFNDGGEFAKAFNNIFGLATDPKEAVVVFGSPDLLFSLQSEGDTK